MDLEERTQLIGSRILAAANGRRLLSPLRWIDDRLMDLSFRDEHVKAQLFRFVDVLPTLKTGPAVVEHLRQYLMSVADRLPRPLAAAVRRLPASGVFASTLASAASIIARRMACRFIAAADPASAVDAIARLRRRGVTFSLDVLGEAVLSDAEAAEYQRLYLNVIRELPAALAALPPHELLDSDHAGPIPRTNLSVKLSSLYSQFDPLDPEGTSRAVRDRLRPILHAARAANVFINVDMESHAYKDLTLRIFREILDEADLRDWPHAGIAIQAYLRSSADDLRGLLRWAEKRGTCVWVRLVKGAYWDYELVTAIQNNWPTPVFTRKSETDASYEKQTRLLLENHQILRPAFASHNVRSIAHVLALAADLGIPSKSIEFQMLYGMAEPIRDALVARGQRVRIYTPMGQLLPGMAYLVRRLLENTSNESFLRAGFRDRLPPEILLMNPVTKLNVSVVRHGTPAPAPQSGEPALPRFVNEPLADFSVAAARDALRLAIDDVGRKTGREYPLIIDGQPSTTGRWIESANPSHRRQVIGRCAAATEDDARRAIACAKRAFAEWSVTPVRQRAELLVRVAAIMRRRRNELAAWAVLETAKQWREADADVAEAIDFCEFYAREMLRLASPRSRAVPGEDNQYFYEPRGVAVIIAPWNFPLAILTGMTVAALVTGNTVVMKPAEQSAVIGALLMEMLQEAGVPAGVASCLQGAGEQIGPVLVGHPDVSMIAFTGSRQVGLAINRLAAETPSRHVKQVIAEMGGKNAIIVDEDADLDDAVDGVVASAFGYAGQKCSACSRAIVLAGIYDAFLQRTIEATRSLKIGPAEDPGAFVGPVIDQEARDRILKMIDAGRREARLAFAADLGSLAEEGFYVAPHIFADVPPTASIAQQEIFGPVLAVMRAADLDDALGIARGTPYALTGGLYSRSPVNIARVRREYRVGNLYINRKITGALVDRQPFGGFALSGVGSKAGGPDYLLQFLLPRTVTENTIRHGFTPDVGGGSVGVEE